MDICVLRYNTVSQVCFFFVLAASPSLSHITQNGKKVERMLHNNFERCLRVALVCSATNHYTFLCALILEFISKLPHGIFDADSAECCRFFVYVFYPWSSVRIGECSKDIAQNIKIAKLESINNNGIFESEKKYYMFRSGVEKPLINCSKQRITS